MINFHNPTVADKEWVDTVLKMDDRPGCEYNFMNIYGWGTVYGQQIARVDDFFVARIENQRGTRYLYPAGSGDVKSVLELMMNDAENRGHGLEIVALNQPQKDELEQIHPGLFEFTENRDNYDYLYEIEKMCTLAGKKLHGKRNHINRFLENHPEWSYESITQANIGECMELNHQWNVSHEEENESESPEVRALTMIATDFDALGMVGGLIRVDGNVVAFTIGDLLGKDLFNVHFEKAYGDMQGAYPMINREFARHIHETYPHVKFLNREEDMGIEGLRRAKESYYPERLVEKFTAKKK